MAFYKWHGWHCNSYCQLWARASACRLQFITALQEVEQSNGLVVKNDSALLGQDVEILVNGGINSKVTKSWNNDQVNVLLGMLGVSLKVQVMREHIVSL